MFLWVLCGLRLGRRSVLAERRRRRPALLHPPAPAGAAGPGVRLRPHRLGRAGRGRGRRDLRRRRPRGGARSRPAVSRRRRPCDRDDDRRDRGAARGRARRRRRRLRRRRVPRAEARHHARQPHRGVRGGRARPLARRPGRRPVGRAHHAGLPGAAAALVLAAAVSRAGALLPLAFLRPARPDGAGAAAGRLDPRSFAASCGVALSIALILGLAATGLVHALAAALGAALGSGAMTALAKRHVGGQTGDVAGASQQWAEIAAWCGLLIGRPDA